MSGTRGKKETILVDHEGNEFSSLIKMAKFWKINHSTLRTRLKINMPLKEALTTPVMSKGRVQKEYLELFNELEKNPIDYKGNKYECLESLAIAYNLGVEDIRARIYSGWSLEETLNSERKAGIRNDESLTVCDYEGRIFSSLEAMVKHYGISKSTYYRGLRAGKSLEEILDYNKRKRKAYVIEGTKFKTLNNVALQYNISRNTLSNRLRSGESIEEAVINKARAGSPIPMKDFEGRQFESKRAIAEYYNKSVSTVESRLKRGENLEEALTKPSKHKAGRKGKEVTDDNGREFRSIKELAREYKIPYNILVYRLRNKWEMKDALTLPVGTCLKKRGPKKK